MRRTAQRHHDRQHARGSVLKSILLGTARPDDSYIKASELHFNAEVSRAVLLVRTVSEPGASAVGLIQNLFRNLSFFCQFFKEICFDIISFVYIIIFFIFI